MTVKVPFPQTALQEFARTQFINQVLHFTCPLIKNYSNMCNYVAFNPRHTRVYPSKRFLEVSRVLTPPSSPYQVPFWRVFFILIFAPQFNKRQRVYFPSIPVSECCAIAHQKGAKNRV